MTQKNITTLAAPEQGAVRPAHHKLGPSKWPALLTCPCFEGKPPTADTQRGTDLHAIFEAAMRGEYDGEPNDALERHVVNAAMEIRRTHEPTLGRYYVEQVVELPDPRKGKSGYDSGIFGRLDLAWVESDTLDLHIADLKMCENPDRDYRPQLLAYAAGMVAYLSLEGPRNVVLHLIYADTGHTKMEVLDIGDAWTEYAKDFFAIERLSGSAGAPRQCGWCDLCAKFGACDAPREVAVAVTAGTLAEAPTRWCEFSGERKAQLCAIADTVAKWAGAIKSLAGDDAKAGMPIEDPANGIFYGLQERKGRIDLPTQETWHAVKDRLTKDGYMACLSVNTTALKAALKNSGMKAKDVDALLESVGARGPSTFSFVRKGVA